MYLLVVRGLYFISTSNCNTWYTVKSVYNDHLWEPKIVAVIERSQCHINWNKNLEIVIIIDKWSLFRGGLSTNLQWLNHHKQICETLFTSMLRILGVNPFFESCKTAKNSLTCFETMSKNNLLINHSKIITHEQNFYWYNIHCQFTTILLDFCNETKNPK